MMCATHRRAARGHYSAAVAHARNARDINATHGTIDRSGNVSRKATTRVPVRFPGTLSWGLAQVSLAALLVVWRARNITAFRMI